MAVILYILESIKFDLKDKQACVVANSKIFGESLRKVLECRQARVCVARADDKDLTKKTKKADLLISAAGRKRFIKSRQWKTQRLVLHPDLHL